MIGTISSLSQTDETILLYTKIPWSVCLHIHGLSHNYCDDYGSYGIESRWSCNRASIFVQSIITWHNVAWEALLDSFFRKMLGDQTEKIRMGEFKGVWTESWLFEVHSHRQGPRM